MISYTGTACLATVVCAMALPGHAQSNYPNKPVRLIVGAGPGGSGDLLGRALAHKLSELWGQQVVIDNRPGAGTVMAPHWPPNPRPTATPCSRPMRRIRSIRR